MSCRRHVAQLGHLYPQFREADTDVLVLLGDSIERAIKYAASLKLPFPVLSDPERAVYHSYDLEKAYILIQRTASAIVNREGKIVYIKRATSAMQWRQESQELLKTVQALAQ